VKAVWSVKKAKKDVQKASFQVQCHSHGLRNPEIRLSGGSKKTHFAEGRTGAEAVTWQRAKKPSKNCKKKIVVL